MPANHGKQKQKEKQKKKREIARKRASRGQSALAMPSTSAILKMAGRLPFGPCFVSADWDQEVDGAPTLVTIVATRLSPQGVLIPAIALVDRTCLGVKNAFVAQPISEIELHRWLEPMRQAHGDMRQVEPILVQSIVYNAIDYAKKLGFLPHRDFPEPVFGPRPEVLLDTFLARRERPFYIVGPDDDAQAIIDQIERAVGEGNYDVVVPVESAGGDDDEDEDDA